MKIAPDLGTKNDEKEIIDRNFAQNSVMFFLNICSCLVYDYLIIQYLQHD